MYVSKMKLEACPSALSRCYPVPLNDAIAKLSSVIYNRVGRCNDLLEGVWISLMLSVLHQVRYLVEDDVDRQERVVGERLYFFV